jgi:F0F1-type ATP synthase assembly protein I
MKNVTKLLVELIFTVVVAGILSILLGLFLWFITANLDVLVESRSYIDFVSGILFGLIVGYKLKALVLENKKPVAKKKK